jgi:hypothetical protein
MQLAINWSYVFLETIKNSKHLLREKQIKIAQIICKFILNDAFRSEYDFTKQNIK